MPWHEIKNGYRHLTLRERDNASIEGGVAEFWTLYAEYVLGEMVPAKWDHLYIDVRGIDESFGVYPQLLNAPPFQAPWASLAIHRMGFDYREAFEEDGDETKTADVEIYYATLLAKGAHGVGLARLLQRADGLLLRFVSFSEPLLEQYLTPQ